MQSVMQMFVARFASRNPCIFDASKGTIACNKNTLCS